MLEPPHTRLTRQSGQPWLQQHVNNFFGGGGIPCRDFNVEYSNLLLASKYIGGSGVGHVVCNHHNDIDAKETKDAKPGHRPGKR